ncbi:MAG: VTT domain-containing protein [Acidobacteria bacterium]|nr:VTT domain-containing protein [Acidobacteriota bacterium]
MDKSKPFYRKKRFFTIVLFLVVVLAIALNFRTVADFVKTTGVAALDYAREANPLLSGLILGGVAIVDSSFFSLPEGNDILLVAFAYLKPYWTTWFVFISAVGSLIGSLMLFSMGRKGGDLLIRKRFSAAVVMKTRVWFERYDIWAILIPCVLPPPMPFKLFVVMAGVLKFSYSRFALAVFIGRMIRYGTWGILTVIFRDQIQVFMREHLLALGFAVILALLLTGLSFWLYRRFTRSRPQNGNPVSHPVPGDSPSIQAIHEE